MKKKYAIHFYLDFDLEEPVERYFECDNEDITQYLKNVFSKESDTEILVLPGLAIKKELFMAVEEIKGGE